ncbi:MAG: hypothetical protein QXK54_02860 [Ignisphaera sp.]
MELSKSVAWCISIYVAMELQNIFSLHVLYTMVLNIWLLLKTIDF